MAADVLHKKDTLSAAVILFLFFLFFLGSPSHALTEDTAWLRAKITFGYSDESVEIDESMIVFAEEEEGYWEKDEDDDWWYYSEAVQDGDVIKFIDGVQLPDEWGNETLSEGFFIDVTAELAEIVDDDDILAGNTYEAYEETFDEFSARYEVVDPATYVIEGDLEVTIKEYELDSRGREVSYRNNKTVYPGEAVSKIVYFVISGDVGGIEDIDPDDISPVKNVYYNGVDVDGGVVPAGSTLIYNITFYNPANEAKTFVVSDGVSSKLTVLETGGAMLDDTNDDGTGGDLTWEVDVDAENYCTVSFSAKVPDTVTNGWTVVTNTGWVGIYDNADVISKSDGLLNTYLFVPVYAAMTDEKYEDVEFINSNTVVTSIGGYNAIAQRLSRVGSGLKNGIGSLYRNITRQTGDSSNLLLYVLLLALGIIVVAVVAVRARRKRKLNKLLKKDAEENYDEEYHQEE